MAGNREDQSPGFAKRDRIPTVSRVLADGTLIELLYSASEARTIFAVWRGDTWKIENEFDIGGERLVPFSPRNNIIKNEIVLLPSKPEEFGSKAQLVDE